MAFTPLSTAWFVWVSGLEPELVEVARAALPFGIGIPVLTVLVSLYTGYLVQAHATKAIPESVGLRLGVTVAVLFWGVFSESLPGVQVTLLAMTLGAAAQIVWLRRRQFDEP